MVDTFWDSSSIGLLQTYKADGKIFYFNKSHNGDSQFIKTGMWISDIPGFSYQPKG